jgi:hypothetical protein
VWMEDQRRGMATAGRLAGARCWVEVEVEEPYDICLMRLVSSAIWLYSERRSAMC